MTLFEECIAVLQKYSIIEDSNLKNKILSNLNFTFYGKLDFSTYADCHKVSLNKIRLLPSEREYYVVWNDCTVPIIKCNITELLNNIDDVLAVSFDTWLISVDMKQIIEFYHEGDVNLYNIL
ncbi:MAG: hypothetical protein K2K06_03335 [Oscillospiraceae bacterium]|nr:hypothetical protein [Oscillospiraceae bacterium]